MTGESTGMTDVSTGMTGTSTGMTGASIVASSRLDGPLAFHRPQTLTELQGVVNALTDAGTDFRFCGGNTDLMPLLKSNAIVTDALISLSAINELKGIHRRASGTVRIGAGTSLSTLIQSPLLQQYAPALVQAASRVASAPIRNQATIGGNVLVTNRCIYYNQTEHNRDTHNPCYKARGDFCHVVKSAKRGGNMPLCQARFVSDTVPVLLLLDAQLELAGASGTRRVALRDFYLPEGLANHKLEAGEVLLGIEFTPAESRAIQYQKLAIREVLDFPSLGVAVAIDTGEADFDWGVAVTGVQTRPGLFTYRRDDFATIDTMLIQSITDATAFAVTYNQDFFPRAYRKEMIDVLVRRGLDVVQSQQRLG